MNNSINHSTPNIIANDSLYNCGPVVGTQNLSDYNVRDGLIGIAGNDIQRASGMINYFYCHCFCFFFLNEQFVVNYSFTATSSDQLYSAPMNFTVHHGMQPDNGQHVDSASATTTGSHALPDYQHPQFNQGTFGQIVALRN